MINQPWFSTDTLPRLGEGILPDSELWVVCHPRWSANLRELLSHHAGKHVSTHHLQGRDIVSVFTSPDAMSRYLDMLDTAMATEKEDDDTLRTLR